MKNTFILKKAWLNCLLILLWHFSSGQSHIEIKGKDTAVTFSTEDVRKANLKLVELSGCKEERDSIFSELRAYQGLSANQKANIAQLKEAILYDDKILIDKDKLLVISDKEIMRNNRKIRFIKLERNGLVVAVIVLVVKMVLIK